jgi:hypothetical protein
MKIRLVGILGIVALTSWWSSAAAAWIPLGEGAPRREAPALEVIETSTQGIVLEFSLPGLERSWAPRPADANGRYERLSIPGCTSTLEIGAPALPVYNTLVGLEQGRMPQVEILEAEFKTLDGLRLAPTLAPVFEGQQAPFWIDDALYATDAEYPGHIAAADAPEIMRDLVVSRLHLNPVQYNPVTRRARVCTRLRLRLREASSGPALEAAQHFISPELENYYRSTVCNYEELNLPPLALDSDAIKYLVISLPQYYDELAPLANWRYQMGYPLRLVSVDAIGGTSAAIKDYISDLYFSDGLEYVLLVGDIDEIPAAYWTDTYSDAWYSCVDPGGNSDMLADLGIGRITFNSPAELTHQIDKIMSYLTAPASGSNWAERDILAAHKEDYPGKYTACSEEIRTYPYSVQVPIFDTAYGGAGAGNSDVIAAVNAGRGIVNYRGHGSETSWATWGSEGSLTKTQIAQMENPEMLFVCFSICCSNMHLNYGSDCLSESFMKDDNAAIAVLSAWEPSYTDANHTFDKRLFRAIYDEGINTIGYVENWANIGVHSGHGSYGDTNIRMYLWLGDPATDVWTAQPTPLLVSHPAAITLSPQDVEVTVQLHGEALAGARVCLLKQGESFGYGFTDASGTARIAVDPATPGDLTITVTGHNGLPYEEAIEVFTPAGPWIVLDEFQVDDSVGGNGDGLADYGEEVVLETAVKNLGLQIAQQVGGELSGDDPEVTITAAAESYGNIDPEQVVWGQNGFGVLVSQACTDGHTALFDLAFRDALDSLWTGRLALTLHAPQLRADQLRIDDSVGGNGNGQLDPGESVDLYITALNRGTGAADDLQAQISSNDPFLSIQTAAAAYPDLPGGNEAENLTPFAISVDAACPDGHVISLPITFTTVRGYNTTDTIFLQVGGFLDDMENGRGDWVHFAVTGGFLDEWHISTQRNHTPDGASAWKCGDRGGGDYSDNVDAGLVTPALYLGGPSKLYFWHWLSAELNSGDYAWDGGIVEITTDQGATWQQITPEGGYPYKISSNPASPFSANTPCYSGSVNWEQEEFDLSAYSGEVHIRFRFGTDGNVTREGWYIDDVRVVAAGSGITLQILNAPATGHPGDTLEWQVSIGNSGANEVVDYWLSAEPVSGPAHNLLLAENLTLPGGYSGTQTLTLTVPGSTPVGTYTVWNRIGNYPSEVLAEDQCIIELLAP